MLRSFKPALCLILLLALTCACAPGAAATPAEASIRFDAGRIGPQRSSGIPIKPYDTTAEQRNSPGVLELSQGLNLGELMASQALVGFDPADKNHEPIITETLAFKNGSYVAFYDKDGKVLEVKPFAFQFSVDNKTQRFVFSYAGIYNDQDGKPNTVPYMSLVSKSRFLPELQGELLERYKNGDPEAFDLLMRYFYPPDRIDEVDFINLATNKSLVLEKAQSGSTGWSNDMVSSLAQLNPLRNAVLGTAPTATPTPTPRVIATPTLGVSLKPEASSAPVPIDIAKVFPYEAPDFFSYYLLKLDPEATTHFSVENGKTYLTVGAEKVEIDPQSARFNVDINGNPLTVEDNAFVDKDGNKVKIMTIQGAGEFAGKTYSYTMDATIYGKNEYGVKTETVIPAHWFEVIKPNHPVDQKATPEEQMKQREEALADPVEVTVEQVQSGEWAQSVLLSGLVRPFPDDWKFQKTDVYHNSNEQGTGLNWTQLDTSIKIPVDMFGKVEGMGGIFLHPWQVWNPEDLEKPDHRQIAIFSVAQGSERTTPDQIKKYLDFVYNQGNYPFLFISVPEGNASPVAEGSLAQAFSLSKIQSLPGNDPADNPFIDLTIQAAAADPEGDQDLWQWHYYIPMSSSLQNYLWLADLTKY